MRKHTLLLTFVMACLVAPLTGCPEEKGPMEKAGEKVDKAVEKTGDAIEEAGDEIEDEVD